MTRVLATRLHGDGTETVVADELPVTAPKVMRALTGAGGLTGSITPEVARLRDSNGPVLLPGRTAVYALSEHGVVLGGGVLTPGTTRQGAHLRVTCAGHAGYLAGQPYDGVDQWVGVDPADLIRHAWARIQSRAHHDLGMVVDATTTPVRIGTPERDVSFTTGAGEDVEFTAGPVKWNYWTTHDLGRVVDQLATSIPIDYTAAHTWDGATVTHALRLGYPRLGRRRHDLVFEVGVNILTDPSVGTADDVSDVVVVGAGEGSSARRGTAHRDPGGLGRTVTVIDKTLTSDAACATRARQHLDWLSGGDEVTTITVHDHPNAPLGSWAMGDDIHVRGNHAGWAGDLDVWVRVLSDETDPHAGTAVLTVTRAERVG